MTAPRPRPFIGGEMTVSQHADLKVLLVSLGQRRKLTVYQLATEAGLSNAIADYIKLDNPAQGTFMGQLLKMLDYHQFQARLEDRMFQRTYPVADLAGLRAALCGVAEVRGMTPNEARKQAGNSGAMSMFMSGSDPKRNIQSNMLFTYLEHYGIVLVVRDLLHRSVVAGTQRRK